MGATGIPPLDMVIKKVNKLGYAHHIERLMILGSFMLLLEVDPKVAHCWFMEMFVDSAEWVMGPNVFGMALFSDGGLFATKPYFCGANYYKKMGGCKSGPWEDAVDGLYWGFIMKHKKYFSKNQRMHILVKAAEAIDPQRRAAIDKAALDLKNKLTY